MESNPSNARLYTWQTPESPLTESLYCMTGIGHNLCAKYLQPIGTGDNGPLFSLSFSEVNLYFIKQTRVVSGKK